MIVYGFTKELEKPFEETVKIVTEELKKEGFGILTKIDVKHKFKQKREHCISVAKDVIRFIRRKILKNKIENKLLV